MCRKNDRSTLLKAQEVPLTARRSKKVTRDPPSADTRRRKQRQMLPSVVARSGSTNVITLNPATRHLLTNPSSETIPSLTDENAVSKLISKVKHEVETDRQQAQQLKDLQVRLDGLIALNIANEESLDDLRQKRAQEQQELSHMYGIILIPSTSLVSRGDDPVS